MNKTNLSIKNYINEVDKLNDPTLKFSRKEKAIIRQNMRNNVASNKETSINNKIIKYVNNYI